MSPLCHQTTCLFSLPEAAYGLKGFLEHKHQHPAFQSWCPDLHIFQNPAGDQARLQSQVPAWPIAFECLNPKHTFLPKTYVDFELSASKVTHARPHDQTQFLIQWWNHQ